MQKLINNTNSESTREGLNNILACFEPEDTELKLLVELLFFNNGNESDSRAEAALAELPTTPGKQ